LGKTPFSWIESDMPSI